MLQLLIEPKPREPMKHQYDYDAQTVIAFLKVCLVLAFIALKKGSDGQNILIGSSCVLLHGRRTGLTSTSSSTSNPTTYVNTCT